MTALSPAGRRRKGATWATDAVAFLQQRVSPAVTLTAPGAAVDRGDAAGLPCLVEFKNCASIELGAWSTQAERAADTCGWHRWLLFIKRRGKAEARDGWMVVPAWFGAELLQAWLPSVARPVDLEDAADG